jgi:FG-GAP-like repeat
MDAAAVSNPSPADAPAGVTFPVGFLRFTVAGVALGGATAVTITLPGGVKIADYYKYGPTPDNLLPHWYRFAFDGATGAEIHGHVITLHLIDGQRGDDDLAANGTIVDPGAAAGVVPSVRASCAAADFDKDGNVDILWRQTSTGQVWIWRMNGTQLQATNPFVQLGTSPAGSDWQITGTGDFDKDGNTDILWRHAPTGQVWIWRMNGTHVQATNPFVHLGTSPAGSDWQITGTGDFDRDGNTDILWRHSPTGQVWIWRMNGTHVQDTNPYVHLGTSPAGSDWQITGTGDFDRDGNTDILWRHSPTGQVWIWRMNGTRLQTTNPYVQIGTSPAANDWQIVSTGDFDKDRNYDILWRQVSTGEAWLWRMRGTQLQTTNPFIYLETSPAGTDW